MINWIPKSQGIQNSPPLPMPEPLWWALSSRGIHDHESLKNYISPSLSALKDPFSIQNMEKGVLRTIEALEKNEKIAIYADFDLDGTSGLALMYEGLKSLGFENVVYYQPKRLSEGYGLHKHAIDELVEQNVKLIITVDVGVTAVEPALRAKELGVDLIITDHHQRAEVLPECYALINPNVCGAELGYLCGAGVAFYFILGLRKVLNQKNISTDQFNPKDLLDFFVIGTLTDMVPLVGDNRALIKHGLLKISQTQRPGLKKLIEVLGLESRTLTSQDVAIQIAPKLNALSRMEAEYLPRDILLAQESDSIDEMIQVVLGTQEQRKSFQKNAVQKALEMYEQMGQQGYCWVWSEDFHKGVIGLVATAISQKFRVPTFVGSLAEGNVISGSARIPEGSSFSLIEILNFSSKSLVQFGGHVAAAGFKLDTLNALEFDKLLNQYFSQNQESLKKEFFYDSEIELKDLNPTFMNWVSALEPYGKDFPVWVFKIRKLKVVNKKELKGGHLKLTFTDSSQLQKIDGLWFSPETSINIFVNEFYDVLSEVQWNYFNGKKTLQIRILDMKSSI